MINKIFYIGGSPCSGKSTIANKLAIEYNAYLFKTDEYLVELVTNAANKGLKTCRKAVEMTADETWMRTPEEKCKEEFQIYNEISTLVFEKLRSIDAEVIIAEGTAFTPEVMESIEHNHYICLIPTDRFQISHYQKREWINDILKDCSDKKKAFDNWMKRDILFAKQVEKQCKEKEITCIINDGSKSVDELYEIVKRNLKI